MLFRSLLAQQVLGRHTIHGERGAIRVEDDDVELLLPALGRPPTAFERWNGDTVLGANGRILRCSACGAAGGGTGAASPNPPRTSVSGSGGFGGGDGVTIGDAVNQLYSGGGLGAGAGGHAQPLRRMRMARGGQRCRHAAEPLGPLVLHSVTHANTCPRLVSSARPTRETGGRPSTPLMKPPVSTSASRSMPVWMPMPCSMNTTSSVATLPVAPLA